MDIEGAGLPPKKPSRHLHDSDYSWHDGETPSAKKGSLKVAMVCMPASGHMLPLLHIATELVKRGHCVTVYTTDFGANEFEKKVHQVGAEIVSLDMKGKTEQDLKLQAKAEKRTSFLILQELMSTPLRRSFMTELPDVVVSDFATLAGMDVAADLGIPLVINLPGPLALFREVMGMSDVATAFSFCGFHFSRTRLTLFSLLFWANTNKMGTWSMHIRRHVAEGAVVLVQTIWALDQPAPLFPNVVVTGPVLPPAADLRQKLAEEHPELHQFLQASGPDGVVYVTTGSMAQLEQWQVEDIYHGLKKTGFHVVWSLKEKQQALLPVRDDPHFYISRWTPQAELLQDGAVRVVITHCGWGGTLECMTASKPVVTIPFFGDQPTNARLLVKAGAGEHIGKSPSGSKGTQNPYKKGDFTADTVAAAVTKVMTNDSYKKAVGKMMNASRACGGAEAAVQQIEWAARYGTGHLKSDAFLATSGTHGWNGLVLGVASMVACVGLLVYTKALKK
mmetsp:Transcript_31949/g.57290  ORF Transcript_31949/g.57290 Transcript_31949/m.57290 type:complete len:505 (-) Transcript_31949:350-1864(-)